MEINGQDLQMDCKEVKGLLGGGELAQALQADLLRLSWMVEGVAAP